VQLLAARRLRLHLPLPTAEPLVLQVLLVLLFPLVVLALRLLLPNCCCSAAAAATELVLQVLLVLLFPLVVLALRLLLPSCCCSAAAAATAPHKGVCLHRPASAAHSLHWAMGLCSRRLIRIELQRWPNATLLGSSHQT
jgi:hypothetical protein